MVRSGIRDICDNFDRKYWRRKDREQVYPSEFVDGLAENGWFGALVPEEYGGAGMSTSEVVVFMEQMAACGGSFSAAQAVHGGLSNVPPIVNYGSDELKEELLSLVASGDVSIQAFALTESNAGCDSTSIKTCPERDGDKYVIDGQKK